MKIWVFSSAASSFLSLLVFSKFSSSSTSSSSSSSWSSKDSKCSTLSFIISRLVLKNLNLSSTPLASFLMASVMASFCLPSNSTTCFWILTNLASSSGFFVVAPFSFSDILSIFLSWSSITLRSLLFSFSNASSLEMSLLKYFGGLFYDQTYNCLHICKILSLYICRALDASFDTYFCFHTHQEDMFPSDEFSYSLIPICKTQTCQTYKSSNDRTI